MRQFDQSPRIARLLERLSAGLARRRGLPIIIGIFLIAVSFILHLALLSAPSQTLEVLWSITHHGGILIALIGILLVEPLGR